jgi:hypothetical protein
MELPSSQDGKVADPFYLIVSLRTLLALTPMGLITVQERRREGQKNLSNVVRVVSREWQLWIKQGGQRSAPHGSKSIGFKKTDPTDKGFKEGRRNGIPPETSAARIQPNSTWENRRRAIGKAGGG